MSAAGEAGPVVALIVAAAENGVIGAQGGLPWRISDDLKHFKSLTLGKPVVMGRKTYQSIGRPLPGRRVIVVSRDQTLRLDGVAVADGLDAALRLARRAAVDLEADEIMIAGGAEIYRAAARDAGRLYLTRVLAEVEGDARFDLSDFLGWRRTLLGVAEQKPGNDFGCEFLRLDRPETKGA